MISLLLLCCAGSNGGKSRNEANKHMAQLEAVMRRFDNLPPNTQECVFECPGGLFTIALVLFDIVSHENCPCGVFEEL